MPRLALGIQYSGHGYYGWQRQQGDIPTLQKELEEALSFVANEPIQVICAGRTDSGVHATAQVVHFDTAAERPLRSWILGANTQLSSSISVQWARLVSDDFHARYRAMSRRYLYIIYNAQHRPGIFRRQMTWHLYPLALEPMQQAASYLLGEHDFNAFRSAQCQANTSIRSVQTLRVKSYGPLFVMEIKANAFLHHMVRNIAGMMMEIGQGKRQPLWARQLLDSKDRKQGAAMAAADGLYLSEVTYPEIYNIPQTRDLPFFYRQVCYHKARWDIRCIVLFY